MMFIYFLIASSIPLIAFAMAQLSLTLVTIEDLLEKKLFLFVFTILFHVLIVAFIYFIMMYSHKLF